MKKIVKFILIALFLVFIQETGVAQSIEDQSQVLQKCIDLEELQEYLLQDENNNKQVHILNFPVVFPSDINVSKFGQTISFDSREDIRNINPNTFFSFSTFSLTDNTASIDFEISSGRLTTSPVLIKYNVSFEKSEGNWTVTNLTSNNQ